MKTLAILLGEHPCIVNILFGPMTVHYIERFYCTFLSTLTSNKKIRPFSKNIHNRIIYPFHLSAYIFLIF